MNLRVKAIALSLIALTTFAGGTAAFADDDDDDHKPVPGVSVPAEGEHSRPHHPHPEEDELHDRYGEDVGQVNLPPLVVREKTGAANTGAVQPIEVTSKKQLVNAGITDPVANLPVDPSTINPNQGTPADTFFNSATVGLGVMGAGVVALGGVALRRSIKLRKDPKADFLYQ
jgi:hypothetical protein